MKTIQFDVLGKEPRSVQLAASKLTIAGWTGRNSAQVLHHIKELADLGVTPPKRIPTFYRLSHALLTTDAVIETVGSSSSGEAEYCLFALDGEMYVAVGSDHTDRALEAHEVTLSKQVCAKPISRDCWRFSDVEPHWDSLVLRSYIEENGAETVYQESSVSELLHPRELVSKLDAPLRDGEVLFGGTVPVKGGIRAAHAIRVELHDPVLNRTLVCEYRTETL